MIKQLPVIYEINIAGMKTAIDATLLQLIDEAAKMLLPTYHNWEQKPEWKIVKPKTVNGAREAIYQTNSTPFVWVDEGTDGPYEITIKNAPFLKFRPDSRPKTVRGSMVSGPGFPGSTWRTALKVMHPGIEPRDFTQTTADKLSVIVAAIIQSGIDAETEKW